MKRSIVLFSLAVTIIFFLVGFFTINDYGMSWDETLHYRRGQAYLHYYFTGKTDYSDLSELNLRRSVFQSDEHDMIEILKIDGAHGPLSDQLASFFNYVLYQKLGVVGDLESYHLYVVLASSVMVFVVVAFVAETFGIFAGLVSFLALVTYPLYWSEAHFNVKDPVQAAYFSGVLWAFWKSQKRGSVRWLWVMTLLGTLALGTKINIVFAPLILGIYVLVSKRNLLKFPRKYSVILITTPLLMLVGMYISWPFLWGNITGGVLKILAYYKNLGTGFDYQDARFYIFGFNSYALRWISVTTPPITLLLTILGLGFSWRYRKKHEGVVFLWIIWLLLPIIRVSLPGTSIYGGVRQIFEFVPALVIIAGVGAKGICDLFKKESLKKVAALMIVVLFVWPIVELIKWHPYENTYFNFLIGGLRGARDYDFPSWGNNFGLAYKEGVEWLNENAPEGARLSLIQGTTGNIPEIWIRRDIDYYNKKNWSGINRAGEYLMELTFNDTGRSFYYTWEYATKFLEPVYEVKVDEVPILKIWKNDIEHTREGWRLEELQYGGEIDLNQEGKVLNIRLEREEIISRLKLFYEPSGDCLPVETGFVELSTDGKIWMREKDWIPFPQMEGKSNMGGNEIEFMVAGKRARQIRFVFDRADSCALIGSKMEVSVLSGND